MLCEVNLQVEHNEGWAFQKYSWLELSLFSQAVSNKQVKQFLVLRSAICFFNRRDAGAKNQTISKYFANLLVTVIKIVVFFMSHVNQVSNQTITK